MCKIHDLVGECVLYTLVEHYLEVQNAVLKNQNYFQNYWNFQFLLEILALACLESTEFHKSAVIGQFLNSDPRLKSRATFSLNETHFYPLSWP